MTDETAPEARQDGDLAVNKLLLKDKDKAAAIWESLDTHGYAVVDNVFGAELCTKLRTDIKSMADKKLLESSQNMLATEKSEVKSLDTMQGSSVLSKANIFERSVVIDGKWVDEKVSSDCPSIAAFWKDRAPGLTKSLASALPLLKISKLDELKLQFNAGSKGCFPMHFDAALHTGRELTCIVYLNPEWKEGHGGELRVYPFPHESIDVPPLNDRMVLFCSHQLLHRILPSHAPRFVFSLWFSGAPHVFPSRPVRASAAESSADKATFAMLAHVFNPSNRKVLSKLIYDAEWAQSVRESFGDKPAVKDALALHDKECAAIAKALSPELLQLFKSCLPLKWRKASLAQRAGKPDQPTIVQVELPAETASSAAASKGSAASAAGAGKSEQKSSAGEEGEEEETVEETMEMGELF